MKAKDKVFYYDPVKKAKDNNTTLYEWEVTYVWDTNTELGYIAGLMRDDETKQKGKDRCNVPVNEIEALNKSKNKS